MARIDPPPLSLLLATAGAFVLAVALLVPSIRLLRGRSGTVTQVSNGGPGLPPP